MAKYPNGRIPDGVLTTIAKGTDANGYWEFQTTQATYARWKMAKAYAEKHFGRTMYIRTGWNIYRPYVVQVGARSRACKAGNCAGAAVPGYSSHGGNWQGRDCLAIDVDNNGLTWAQVWEACRSAGFSCGLITSAMSGFPGGEPWHIIDFNAFGAVPTGGSEIPLPLPHPVEKVRKKNKMIFLQGIDSGGGTTPILVVAEAGVWCRFQDVPATRSALVSQFGNPVVMSDKSMKAFELLFKGAGVSAEEIDTALKDNFDAVVAAIKAISVTGVAGPTAAQIAKAVNDDAAARMKAV